MGKKKQSTSVKVLIVFSLLAVCFLNPLVAQKQDSTKIVYIDNADNQVTERTDDLLIQYLNGSVRAFQDSVYMFCDTAILINNNLTAYGNVIIIQSDSIKIFADSLYYNGDSLRAYFYRNVILENGQNTLYTSSLLYDVGKRYAIYTDTAQLVNDRAKLISVRGIYDLDSELAWFYDKVSVEDEDFDLFTDSLKFDAKSQIAYFLAPTLIDQGKSQIYCEDGYYDLDDKQAEFRINAQYKEEPTLATADILRYDGPQDLITLDGNAFYQNKDDIGSARVISYNRTSGDINLIGDGKFENDENDVSGERIYYNKNTEKFTVRGRSFISDPPFLIYAEDIDYNKNIGGYAIGDVIWKDTAASINLFGDRIDYEEETDIIKAIGFNGRRPLMESYADLDTFFLGADTLRSMRKILPVDSTRIQPDTISYFIADNDVRIFKNDLQAIGDSLSYNRTDSIITLFQSPYLWSDTTQISGDTIDMYMKDGNVDSLYVRPNGMIINSEDLVYFNQIKGRKITANLEEDKIDKMYVDGNAITIYYMLDEEDAYIGVNKTECSNIIFKFINNDISSIHFYVESNSVLYPMNQADHELLKLSGFRWIIQQRPLSMLDVISIE